MAWLGTGSGRGWGAHHPYVLTVPYPGGILMDEQGGEHLGLTRGKEKGMGVRRETVEERSNIAMATWPEAMPCCDMYFLRTH